MRTRGFLDRFIRAMNLSRPSVFTRLFVLLFCGPFFLGGLGVTSAWVMPMATLALSQAWDEAPAVVTSSEVHFPDNDDSAKILIEYEVHYQNETFTGDQYDIGSSATNLAVKRMRKVVEEHPPGKEITVFVNPDDPGQSLITRKLSPQVWIMIPFSFPFLLVGMIGTGYALLSGWLFRRCRMLQLELAPSAPPQIAAALSHPGKEKDRSLTFTAMEPTYQAMGLLCISIFWNGIVSVFLLIVIQEAMVGDLELGSLFLAPFVIPFVLIGVYLLKVTFTSLFGRRPPSWIIACQGVSLTSIENRQPSVEVIWMPLKYGQREFRSCRIGLFRWHMRNSFAKWKKKDPHWQENLIQLKRNTVGQTTLVLPPPGPKDPWTPATADLHLVIQWQSSDGRTHEDSWQLSPHRKTD
ncbi:MAG: DUF3592 domain-containing protein [Akkermansiaceae bacterium]